MTRMETDGRSTEVGPRARPPLAPPRRPWLAALVPLGIAIAVVAALWITVVPPEGWGLAQLLFGAAAVCGAVLSLWHPLPGALLAGLATAAAWGLQLTADPFLLASIGVHALAERRGVRRVPWWLLAAFAAVILVALLLGEPETAPGFAPSMRGALLGAVVLGAAWVLGVRSRQLHEATAAAARTDERLRLAREVHDVLSHSLGAIGVRAGVAAHVTALGEPELRETLREVEQQARDSLGELKQLLDRERAVGTDAAARSAADPVRLEELIRDIERTGQRARVHVDAEYPEDVDRLPAALRTTVYRIVQEAATNCFRHAAASTLRIAVTTDESRVEVRVRDDGGGAGRGYREGNGLAGMRERVEMLGGELHVGNPGDAHPGGAHPGGAHPDGRDRHGDDRAAGFAVVARLPLVGHAASDSTQ